MIRKLLPLTRVQMMIRRLLPLTNAELETKQAKPGLHLILEIWVFFAVCSVTAIAMLMVLILYNLVGLIAFPSPPDFNFLPLDMTTSFMLRSELVPTDLYSLLSLVIIPIFCKFLQNRNMSSLGFRRKGAVSEYLLGLFIGAGMFTLAVVVAGKSITIATNSTSLPLLAVAFLGFLIQGMSLEVLCRGYFMLSIARRSNIAIAVLVSSIAINFLLVNDSSRLLFCNTVLFGIFASIWFIKRGSIWGVAAIHAAWDFVQGCVFGITLFESSECPPIFHISSTTDITAELWNGGSAGLVGGFAVTIVLTVFCILALLMPANKNERAVAETQV